MKPCTVCKHVDAAKISAALKNGDSYRQIAGQFSLSRSALSRHQAHLERTVRKPESDPARALDGLTDFDQDAAWRSIDQKIAEWNREVQDLFRQPPWASTVSTRKTGTGSGLTTARSSKKC